MNDSDTSIVGCAECDEACWLRRNFGETQQIMQSNPGTYALLLASAKDAVIRVDLVKNDEATCAEEEMDSVICCCEFP